MVVKNAKGEELEMEQMLVQSMLNLQLDTFKKMFKNIPLILNNGLKRLPEQLQCFGFKINDIDISFAKS